MLSWPGCTCLGRLGLPSSWRFNSLKIAGSPSNPRVMHPHHRMQVLQHPWMSQVLDEGAQLPATAAAIKQELTRR